MTIPKKRLISGAQGNPPCHAILLTFLLDHSIATANLSQARASEAFWEDRYHATAVEADEHLHRCLVYIDLNMVRAGAVDHPFKWVHSGYREMQKPPKRYAIIDRRELAALCGFGDLDNFQRATADGLSKRFQRSTEFETTWPLGSGLVVTHRIR